jgi:two-component system, sensor histidine kinase PdtaS
MRLDALEHLFRRTQRFRHQPVAGYAFGMLIAAAALAVRAALDNVTPGGLPYLTMIPSVVLTALVAGTGPATLVAAVGAVAGIWFFSSVDGSGITAVRIVALLIYGLTAWTIIAAMHVAASAIQRLDDQAQRLEQQRVYLATMFRELQHRVANNLQFLSSFLGHAKRRLREQPDESDAQIEALRARLTTMAQIHRQLYDPENIGSPFAQIADDLCRTVLRASAASNVTHRVEPSAVVLQPEPAQLVSLFLIEAVMNVLKHAFPKEQKGTIDIALRVQAEGERLLLLVADDGVGSSSRKHPNGPGGLGTGIMTSLASQLGGITKTTLTPEGTTVELSFPWPKVAP